MKRSHRTVVIKGALHDPPKPKTEKSTRLNLRVPTDLHKWVFEHACKNKTTVTRLVVDYLLTLKKEQESVEQF